MGEHCSDEAGICQYAGGRGMESAAQSLNGAAIRPQRMRWKNGLPILVQLYSDRILPITLKMACEWGRLSALRPIPPEDGLLAATALVHRLTFVTRDAKNVEGLGISLVNSWM